MVERSFAHCYETGGLRRCHLRGRDNILKRQLIHVGAFNLSLILRKLLGAGTPRELRNRIGRLVMRVLLLLWRGNSQPRLRSRRIDRQVRCKIAHPAAPPALREISHMYYGLSRSRREPAVGPDCRISGFDFAGALLRPHGWILGAMLGTGGAVSDVLAAANAAGRELAANGSIPANALKTFNQPLVSLEQCLELDNRYFQGELDKLQAQSSAD